MASVQKRVRNGQVRWVARWRDDLGTARSRTFDRRVDAQRWGVAAEAGTIDDSPAGELTVGEWLDYWLDNIVAPRCAAGALAPTTAQGYESRTRLHLQPHIGEKRLVALTRGDVEDLMVAVQASGRSASTARSVRATLSKALADAEARDRVGTNVVRGTAAPEVDDDEPSAFTPEEFDAIMAELDGTYGRAVRWMVLTGMRSSETLGLRWADVDLPGGAYQVSQTYHWVARSAARVVPQTGAVTGRGKTKASRRRTQISEAAVELLREQRAAQAEQRLASVAWVDTDAVFASEVGTRLSAANVRRALRRAIERAGVDPVGASGRGRGLHELRRTFATLLLREGVPVHVVTRLGRWSSPQVLMKAYAGVAEDDQVAAAEVLARRLG